MGSLSGQVKVKASVTCPTLATPWMPEWVATSGGDLPDPVDGTPCSPILQPDYYLPPETTREPFQDKEKLTGENIPGRRQQRPRTDWGKTKQIKQLNQNKKFIIIRRLKEEHVETGEEAGRI